ncbi:MAG TPA: TetR/AcrR family transcriptional regulator C-terminal domain-containing protein [Solirubrobacteraceae bacterium]|nr:TetR/AcrR family transcriptional regulator C-terminal domain-containing protein [Solirubrobacteraceae bacterium]
MIPSSPEPEHALPSPPRRPRHRERPTRRTALTVEAIVAAAIEVLDETGVSGLSMRGVAQQLGTGAASLYAHVSGKEELLELVFDELVGRVPLPEPDPSRWREQIHQMAGDLRRILISHRDVALAGLGRVPSSPKVLEAAEVVVAVMRAGGLSDRVLALGLDQLLMYVAASAFEDSLYEHRGLTPEELDRYFEDVHAFYQRLPATRFPVLASIVEPMTGPDGEERFAFGVDAMLSGFEAMSRGV